MPLERARRSFLLGSTTLEEEPFPLVFPAGVVARVAMVRWLVGPIAFDLDTERSILMALHHEQDLTGFNVVSSTWASFPLLWAHWALQYNVATSVGVVEPDIWTREIFYPGGFDIPGSQTMILGNSMNSSVTITCEVYYEAKRVGVAEKNRLMLSRSITASQGVIP